MDLAQLSIMQYYRFLLELNWYKQKQLQIPVISTMAPHISMKMLYWSLVNVLSFQFSYIQPNGCVFGKYLMTKLNIFFSFPPMSGITRCSYFTSIVAGRKRKKERKKKKLSLEFIIMPCLCNEKVKPTLRTEIPLKYLPLPCGISASEHWYNDRWHTGMNYRTTWDEGFCKHHNLM